MDLDDLTVRFDGQDRPAVDRLDLRVAAGEVVALLGPSGCGKTTVLRTIAGLQATSGGTVRLDGRDVAGVPAHQRGVGLMFQDYALFPHRDVGANVEFGLRMQGRDGARRRARVAEVLELVGLAGWERRAVGPLSGGEQQRVALARALAPEPGVLLLDEPLGALDRTLRDRLLPELGEVFAAVGTTVVYVTHDQAEALALADRVAVMDGGRIVQVGAPRDVWSTPASPFVARFLGFANVDDERVVRPDAVRLVPNPPSEFASGGPDLAGTEPFGEGSVTTVTFRGERTDVVVALDAPARSPASSPEGDPSGPAPPPLTLVASLVTSEAPRLAAGDRVAVHVHHSGLVAFGRRPPA